VVKVALGRLSLFVLPFELHVLRVDSVLLAEAGHVGYLAEVLEPRALGTAVLGDQRRPLGFLVETLYEHAAHRLVVDVLQDLLHENIASRRRSARVRVCRFH